MSAVTAAGQVAEDRPPHKSEPARSDQAQTAPAETEAEASSDAPTRAGHRKTRSSNQIGRTTAAGADRAAPAHLSLRESDLAFASCRLALHRLGSSVVPAAPVHDDGNPDCGIDRPIRVREILPGLTLKDAPLMRCETAHALARWVQDFVRPAARRLPGAPRVIALEPGSTYQCRDVIGSESDAISEHALGNAFDIAAFEFDDGRRLPVAALDDGSADQAFLAAVRGAACMDFTTVLGPGSNAAHEDHLHLDIKERRSGYRVCE